MNITTKLQVCTIVYDVAWTFNTKDVLPTGIYTKVETQQSLDEEKKKLLFDNGNIVIVLNSFMTQLLLLSGISLIEVSYEWDYEKSTIISLIKQNLPHISLPQT